MVFSSQEIEWNVVGWDYVPYEKIQKYEPYINMNEWELCEKVRN